MSNVLAVLGVVMAVYMSILIFFLIWKAFQWGPPIELRPGGFKAWLDVAYPRGRRFTHLAPAKSETEHILKLIIKGYATLGYKSSEFLVGIRNTHFISFDRVIETDADIQVRIATTVLKRDDSVISLLPYGVNVTDLIAPATLTELSWFPQRLITSPHNSPEFDGENYPLDNGLWIVIHKLDSQRNSSNEG